MSAFWETESQPDLDNCGDASFGLSMGIGVGIGTGEKFDAEHGDQGATYDFDENYDNVSFIIHCIILVMQCSCVNCVVRNCFILFIEECGFGAI